MKTGDVVLVFFSDFHRDTLVKVAPKVKIVCMDGTHGTNGYDYHLITLMVKDKTGMGCPVGHCISTREDTVAITIFFNEIRKKCGHRILVDYVMSDDARAYYNAWCNAMYKSTDPPSTKPIPVKCMWHILKNWNQNLSNIVKDNNLREDLLISLRTMLHTKDATLIQLVIIK